MAALAGDDPGGPLVEFGQQGGFDLLHARAHALLAGGDMRGDLGGDFGGDPLLVCVGQHGAIVLRRHNAS